MKPLKSWGNVTMVLLRILFIGFFLFASEVTAQEVNPERHPTEVQYDETDVSPLEWSDSTLEDLRNNDDFDYNEYEQEESSFQRFLSWLGRIWRNFWRWLLGDYEVNKFWTFIIEILPYMIIGGILVFIVWLVIKLNPGAKLLQNKEEAQVFFSEEEEIVRSKDIRKLIQKALEKGDFRLAVRYYYLLILKKLTDAELIAYEFEKTNSDYISEIQPTGINAGFRKATNLYDYIWYGNFDVSRDDYHKAQRTFDQLETQISGSHD